jgi:hypothetical protein
MNDELRDADELDNFVTQYQQDHVVSPASPDTHFAADLMDMADSMQPSAAFLAHMESRLPSQLPIPLNSNGYNQKENNMQLHNRVQNPLWRYQYIPWTLAATLAVVLLTTTILVGLSIWPSISQSSLAASTTTPVPAADKVLPISVGGYVSDFSESTLQQMHDAGLTWIGADLTYTPQANGNTPSLITTAQSLITAAHDKGFRIMLRVSGIPSEMLSQGENYNSGYVQFVSYLATLKADAIQIWNQQNLDIFWQSNQLDPIDPVAYIDMLHQSYKAIKAANPDTMVIIGAPAPTSSQSAFPGKIMNDDLYYQGMAEAYTALGERAADCIGMTYIEGAVAPDQTTGDSRDDYPTRYFPTMLRRAFTPFQSTGLPLCITEFGYLAGHNLESQLEGIPKPFFTDGFEWVKNITAEQQAEWLAGGIKIASEMSSIRIPMVMIWRINGMPLNSLMYAAAIIRPDGSCLACTTIANLKQ